jgi:hypothetical protein
MKLLAFLLLQGFHQKLHNKRYFSWAVYCFCRKLKKVITCFRPQIQTVDNEVEKQYIYIYSCLVNTAYDEIIPSWVQGQDMEKLEVVIDYNSGLGGVDLSDNYLTSCCSKRKRAKNAIKRLMCMNQTCLYNHAVGPEMHSSGNSDEIFENKAQSIEFY